MYFVILLIMARKTSNRNAKSKLRKISAQAISKSCENSAKQTTEDTHNNQGDECNDVDCDCIKRRGQMFLPAYLLEGYDERLNKRK